VGESIPPPISIGAEAEGAGAVVGIAAPKLDARVVECVHSVIIGLSCPAAVRLIIHSPGTVKIKEDGARGSGWVQSRLEQLARGREGEGRGGR
jgi:hypothetical protein